MTAGNYVNASAQRHCECIVVATGRREPVNRVVDRCVGIRVRRAEQKLRERLHPTGVLLELRAKQIGEHVAVHLAGITQALELIPQPTALGIAHEVGLDAKNVSKIEIDLTAAAEDVKTRNRG